MRLTYAIKYVADMGTAIAFYRDKLGLELKFQSPFWTEFATGDTVLALHPASEDNATGSASTSPASRRKCTASTSPPSATPTAPTSR